MEAGQSPAPCACGSHLPEPAARGAGAGRGGGPPRTRGVLAVPRAARRPGTNAWSPGLRACGGLLLSLGRRGHSGHTPPRPAPRTPLRPRPPAQGRHPAAGGPPRTTRQRLGRADTCAAGRASCLPRGLPRPGARAGDAGGAGEGGGRRAEGGGRRAAGGGSRAAARTSPPARRAARPRKVGPAGGGPRRIIPPAPCGPAVGRRRRRRRGGLGGLPGPARSAPARPVRPPRPSLPPWPARRPRPPAAPGALRAASGDYIARSGTARRAGPGPLTGVAARLALPGLRGAAPRHRRRRRRRPTPRPHTHSHTYARRDAHAQGPAAGARRAPGRAGRRAERPGRAPEGLTGGRRPSGRAGVLGPRRPRWGPWPGGRGGGVGRGRAVGAGSGALRMRAPLLGPGAGAARPGRAHLAAGLGPGGRPPSPDGPCVLTCGRDGRPGSE